MTGLFYRPEPDTKPDLIGKLLRMAGYKQADNGSVADYPEDWFDWEPVHEPIEPSDVAKFAPGESVKLDDGTGGTVLAEPRYNPNEGWMYWVNVYDANGPRGTEAWPETAMKRPERYDQPGESTMKDWMDIPPSGEQYYREAMIKDIGQPNSESYGEWFAPIEQHVMDQAKYFHQCPTCGGYMQKHGEDIYECTQCPYSILPERYASGTLAAADDGWDDIFTEVDDADPNSNIDESVEEEDMRPQAFIYSPDGGWIRWGGSNSLHDDIQVQLRRDGLEVGKDCIFGRWYPKNDKVIIYDARLDDDEKAGVAALIQLNAPRGDTDSVPEDE